MVHVVSCHHFVSQDVFLSKQEPVAFCCAEEKLFVAVSSQPLINVHDLDSRGNLIHSFSTVGEVEQLIFCKSGNYVATLEKKTSKQFPLTCVRIYLKWWVDFGVKSPKLHSATSTNFHSTINHPEILELPIKETTLAIACCKKTSALAASIGNTVSVFCQSWKSEDEPKQKHRNFYHVIDIELNFIVKELCILECFFACRSENQVRVFKITAENDNNQISSTSNVNKLSPTSDSNLDEHFIEWRFESCLENGFSDVEWDNHLKQQLHPDSFPITVVFPSIEKANQKHDIFEDCEILGPHLTVKGHKIKAKLDYKAFEFWSCLSYSNINVMTILYREFASQENSTLMSLQLLSFSKSENSSKGNLDPLHAAYMESEEGLSSMVGLPFQFDEPTRSKAVGCFFSTPQKGFLYDIAHNFEMIGSYHYTATCKGAILEPMFLHALTDAGLETYTVHLSHRAISHFENVDNVQNACPDFKAPLCLLSLRPFLSIRHLGMSENHLILISSSDETENSETLDSNSCTIYSLTKPSPQQVFSDLLEVGQLCKSSSSSTYQIILSEGHMILRTQLFLDKSCSEEIEKMYLKSCILLADYYTCSANVSEKILAAPYYHMSQLPVEEVVQRFFGFKTKLKQDILKPLIHYLNPMLLDFKCQTVLSVSKSIAENILDAYMDESPDDLWKVILSPALNNYRLEKAMMMLKRRITSKRHVLSSSSIVADTIAIVSLLLKKNNLDAAQSMMLSSLKQDLLVILKEIHVLLWSNKGISPLGKFILQIRPDVFIDMLIYLVEIEKLKILEIICTLQQECSDRQLHQVALLKEFLEAIVHDKPELLNKAPESIMYLVKIYLKRLVEKSMNRPCLSLFKQPVLFGPRPLWLNKMPPFNGNLISRTCNLSETTSEEVKECLCRSCNEDLLRLQALLYQHKTSVMIREEVLEFLSSGQQEISGQISLTILCLDEERAVKKLLEIAPSALIPYAQDMFGEDTAKWCMLFSMLQKKFSCMSEQDFQYEIYSEIFHGILQKLAETMSIPNFVSILPKGESFYEPYVKLCVKKHRASQLKNKIVELGNEIKALM